MWTCCILTVGQAYLVVVDLVDNLMLFELLIFETKKSIMNPECLVALPCLLFSTNRGSFRSLYSEVTSIGWCSNSRSVGQHVLQLEDGNSNNTAPDRTMYSCSACQKATYTRATFRIQEFHDNKIDYLLLAPIILWPGVNGTGCNEIY